MTDDRPLRPPSGTPPHKNKTGATQLKDKASELQLREEVVCRGAEVAALQTEIATLHKKSKQDQELIAYLQTQLAQLHDATLWRALAPIRTLARKIPTPLRNLIRRVLKLIWWSVTLQLPTKLKARRALSSAAIADAKPAWRPFAALSATNFTAFQSNILADAIEKLRKFPPFEAQRYVAMHSDLINLNMTPEKHIICFGSQEGRKLFSDEAVARAIGCLNGPLPEPLLPIKFPSDAVRTTPVGVYFNNQGNIFMKEIAADFAADLEACGAHVQLLDETAPKDSRPPVCLFVAPHEFFLIGRGKEWLREEIITNSFMLNTEQVQTNWFAKALPYLLMARGVIDICNQSAQLLMQAGVKAVEMQQSLLHLPEGLREQDHDYPLFKTLPAAVKRPTTPSIDWKNRPLDINFFGAITPHRDKFFTRHAGRFASYESFIYCRRAKTPLSLDSADGGLTRLAAHVAAHSKLSLNIHRDEFGYFEWHRIVKLGLYAGSIVISDPCLPHKGFIPGVHYFEENLRYIPDLVDWLLKTRDGQEAGDKMRATNEAMFKNKPPPTESLAEIAQMLWEKQK